MKNIFLFLMFLVIITNTNVYGFFGLKSGKPFQFTDNEEEIWLSMGLTTPGIGVGFLRGVKINKGSRDTGSVSFSPAVQIDVLIEYNYLTLETGIGYTKSSLTYSKVHFLREEITIPLIARIFFDYGKFITYTSMGLKFGIPLRDSYARQFLDGEEISLGENANNGSNFAMDIAFAMGFEVLIADELWDGKHYLGLRVGYDLNVVNPTNPQKMANIFGGNTRDYEGTDFAHDSLNFSLTYRWKFYEI